MPGSNLVLFSADRSTPLPPPVAAPSPSRGEGCVPLRLGHATLGIGDRPRPGEVRQSWHGRLGESRHGWRQPSPLEGEGVAKGDGRGVTFNPTKSDGGVLAGTRLKFGSLSKVTGARQ